MVPAFSRYGSAGLLNRHYKSAPEWGVSCDAPQADTQLALLISHGAPSMYIRLTGHITVAAMAP